jgi:hypothetical protein
MNNFFILKPARKSAASLYKNLIDALKNGHYQLDYLLILFKSTLLEFIMNDCFDHNLKSIGNILKTLLVMKRKLDNDNESSSENTFTQ